ncbi:MULTISPECIES: FadR/GntR family transcriptional regulator [unclassified Modicisalibacter]|uniref:FadR/GntR family transcriptional regulator n=1 Tax=unclassified Modicisalibacter TaxID=2679913 RepID=UPI001CCD5367|nr:MULTISPECIES: FadR/GntR family transcriptional regulator [unclassified Modicisalibacter]MBZ9556520.1 FadR family transcriptional regulator [Modicisalibacter sp. R2A 31.J]MBZ9575011.1 FadR family transcriptional regulator [Modicisalibacter sp. MOD 31.J]
MTHARKPAPTAARRGQRLSATIVATLEREIREGHYPLGSRFPTEAKLMARFGSSRAVIRETIAELRQANLVVTQQGSGTYVASVLPERSVFAMTADAVDQQELRYIYQMRREIEAGAAALAATHATPKDRDAIAGALARLAESLQHGDPGDAHDLALHQAIAQATGNHYFSDFIDFCYNRMSTAISTARHNSARDATLEQIAQAEHHNIVDSILNREPEDARAAMRLHLTNAMRRLGLQSPTG